MTKSNQLSRVCTSCGEKKPLAAFLQLGGAQGTTYGAICSDCRRTATKPKQKELKDTEGQTDSNFRIGARAKITADLEKRRQREDLIERYRKEAKKRVEQKKDKLSQSEIKETLEKQHKAYLDAKRRETLARAAVKTPAEKQTQQRSTGEISPSEQTQIEAKKIEAQIERELKMTTIDLTLPFLDPQGSEMRHQSGILLLFKQWLGSGAPMAKTAVIKELEKMYKKLEKTLFQKQVYDKKQQEKHGHLSDYVKNEFSSSKKR